MDVALTKFAKEINWEITPFYENVYIKSVKQESNKFIFNLVSEEVIPISELVPFYVAAKSNKKFNADILIEVKYPILNEEIAKSYIKFFLKEKEEKLLAMMVNNVDVDNDKNIVLKFVNENLSTKIEKYLSYFSDSFEKFGIKPNSINSDICEEEKKKIQLIKHKKEMELKKSIAKNIEHSKEINVSKSFSFNKVKIVDLLSAEGQKIEIVGKIFKKNFIKAKTGTYIYSYWITDGSDAIVCKTFTKSEKVFDDLDAYKENEYVTIQGSLEKDRYSGKNNIIISKIKYAKNPETERKDNERDKRIEFSVRTKMSTMDGVSSIKDYIKFAHSIGHEGLIISDNENGQAFPDAYNASKKLEDFKLGYGVNFNFLYRDIKAIRNSNDKEMSSSRIVVFDLETTGLYAQHNDIIEFGATEIIDGKLGKSFQFFVKPDKKIPEEITNLTKITNEMVKNAISEKEAIEKMLDIFKDDPIAAHNATFDLSFLNTKLEKYDLGKINNVVIDTLQLSRLLNAKKSHTLEKVAGYYGENYDPTVAHRADYDSDVLARVLIVMSKDLKQLGLNTFDEISKYIANNIYSRQFSFDIQVIAKNQKGLKRLFELITLSHTKNFHKKPILFWEDIEKDRANLLVSNSGFGGKLFDILLTNPKWRIKEEIKKYDFIAMQPPSSYSHLVARGFISKEELEASIKLLIELSKEAKIPVIAISDSRYIDISEKIYHEVLIRSKGLGGTLHPLFKYNEPTPDYPNLSFRTTDEMLEEFSFLDSKVSKEIIVKNPSKIFKLIDEIEIIKKELYKPKIDGVDEKLKEYVYQEAHRIYGDKLPEILEKRITRELDAIIKYGYSVIYWIAHDLVQKSLSDGYLVGSRGSVGSSIVATLANITEVNPLQAHYICKNCKYSEFPEGTDQICGYDLPSKKCPNCKEQLIGEGHNIPFETFLGFKADKVPDIDLNFSGDYQPIIHQEVKDLFGEAHAFRAGTISTIADRTAFGYVKAVAESKDEEFSQAWIEYLAKGITGVKRTTGQHPGGIIVIPKEFSVEDFTPANYPANDTSATWLTTHFDFHSIHDNVLKLDLLGHDDPTAIKMLEDLTGVSAIDIPNNDPKVLSLFSSTKELGIKPADISGEKTGAMGIPEFGTHFVRRMLKSVKVKSFADLVSISGLSHGTDVWTNNAEQLVTKKKLSLSEIIACRDDIMVDLISYGIDNSTSFNIMESVRKGRGLQQDWEEKMISFDVPDWYIDSCKKIKYMFPKAHATAYVKMAWRIAWFKIYHPLAYYSTYFSTRADVFDIETAILGKTEIDKKLNYLSLNRNKRGADKLSNKEMSLIPILEIAQEMYARGYKFNNVSVSESKATLWVIDNEKNSLIPPFSSIDGLGEAAAKSIEIARKEAEFSSVEDFQKRTSVNSTIIKKMKRMGIFDSLEDTNQISLF